MGFRNARYSRSAAPAQLLFQVRPPAPVCLILGAFGRRDEGHTDQRGVAGTGSGMRRVLEKDAGQGVVVLGRDRVEL